MAWVADVFTSYAAGSRLSMARRSFATPNAKVFQLRPCKFRVKVA
jgi:hypothetical protein